MDADVLSKEMLGEDKFQVLNLFCRYKQQVCRVESILRLADIRQ